MSYFIIWSSQFRSDWHTLQPCLAWFPHFDLVTLHWMPSFAKPNHFKYNESEEIIGSNMSAIVMALTNFRSHTHLHEEKSTGRVSEGDSITFSINQTSGIVSWKWPPSSTCSSPFSPSLFHLTSPHLSPPHTLITLDELIIAHTSLLRVHVIF